MTSGFKMSTMVCLELAGNRPRDGLKLALNRSLSEPGPPELPSPTAAATVAAAAVAATTTAVAVVGSSSKHHGLLSPPKRCKLESSSLPTSPCAESATLQRALVTKRVGTLDADSLRRKLERCSFSDTSRNFLIVDCRPFIAYNVNHIRGAINVNCSDRFNRRRLQLGKASLADLATSREGKEQLKRRNCREVIVYDDTTSHVDHVSVGHPLFLVLSTLVEDHREPVLLLGKYYLSCICLLVYLLLL